jgi:CHAT domain-containing protein
VTAFALDADLLLLSATGVGGGGGSGLDGRIPLVSDFLDAGAAAVVFSLWPVGEDAATEFAWNLRPAGIPDICALAAATRCWRPAGELAAWAASYSSGSTGCDTSSHTTESHGLPV